MFAVLFPTVAKTCLFGTVSRPLLGSIQPSVRRIGEAFASTVKRPEIEADHSSPSSVETKAACCHISIPTYAFMAECLDTDSGSLPNLTARRLPVLARKLPSLNQALHYSDDCYINLNTPLASAKQFRTLWRPHRIIHHLLTGWGSKLFVLFNGGLFLFNVTWQ